MPFISSGTINKLFVIIKLSDLLIWANRRNDFALPSSSVIIRLLQLVPMHQSCGGMAADGRQSYTATMISAAKVCIKCSEMRAKCGRDAGEMWSKCGFRGESAESSKIMTAIDNMWNLNVCYLYLPLLYIVSLTFRPFHTHACIRPDLPCIWICDLLLFMANLLFLEIQHCKTFLLWFVFIWLCFTLLLTELYYLTESYYW